MRQRIATLVLILSSCGFRAGQMRSNLLLSTLPAGRDPQRYKGYVEPQFKAFTQRSFYLTMRDGVKIAVQLVLPKDLPADQKIPAVLVMTRYWRARQGDGQPNSFLPASRLRDGLRRRARHRSFVRSLESAV